MSRVKLDIPQKLFNTSLKIPVRITDINYGNHVGNDSIVSIIHEARIQFLQQYDYTELNIEGLGLIMSDLQVEFKNESFYKDIIEVKIGVAEITKVGFALYYVLSVKRNNEEIIIANAKTGMVCYNYQAKKVTSIPKKFLEILSA